MCVVCVCLCVSVCVCVVQVMFVLCMWPVCDVHVACMWRVCGLCEHAYFHVFELPESLLGDSCVSVLVKSLLLSAKFS